MINTRLSNYEKMMMDWTKGITQKLDKVVSENTELKEKLIEIQSQLAEKETERSSKRHNHSSDSEDDHPRKKKSSRSSSSDEESNKIIIEKVCPQ
jgi:uncharacterized membrane protein